MSAAEGLVLQVSGAAAGIFLSPGRQLHKVGGAAHEGGVQHVDDAAFAHHISLPPMCHVSPGVPALGRLPTLHTRSRAWSCTQPAFFSNDTAEVVPCPLLPMHTTVTMQATCPSQRQSQCADLQLAHLRRGSAGDRLQTAGLVSASRPGPLSVCGRPGPRSSAGSEPLRPCRCPKQSGIA